MGEPSCGMNGSVTGSEPAAMMHWSKVTVFVPSLPFTAIAFGPAKPPTPTCGA